MRWSPATRTIVWSIVTLILADLLFTIGFYAIRLADMGERMLCATDLHHAYGRQEVLRGLSLHLNPGKPW